MCCLHLVDDLAREVGADVEHGHDDAAELERRVDARGLQPLDQLRRIWPRPSSAMYSHWRVISR